MKKIISILTIFVIIFSLFAVTLFNVSAADTNIQLSASTVEIGSTVEVTIKMTPYSSMQAVSCVVNYNQDVLKYVSGATSGGAGSLEIVLDDETGKGKDSFSVKLTFTTISVGSSNIAVKDCQYTYQPAPNQMADQKEFTGASTSINVTDKILSANANLKKLSLSKGTLTPTFSADVTSYTANVSNDVTKCSIYATAADSKAKTEGSGVKTLKVGNNTFTVTVTAQSGAQKKYTIVINRAEKSDEPNTDTPDTEVPQNPYAAVVDGETFIVATDISSVKMLSGFTATVVPYNGVDVAAAIDSENNYTIFYLSPEGTSALTPYIYNEEDNTFTKVNYITQGAYDYIIVDFPENFELPKGYYSSNVTIGENTYPCFCSDAAGMDDFSFFYCYVNGVYGIYRYDSREDVIQRSPDVKLISIPTSNEVSDTFFDRFASLSTNSKVILITISIVILTAVALLVLFIISLFKKVDTLDAEINEDEEEFDETEIQDGSEESDDDFDQDISDEDDF